MSLLAVPSALVAVTVTGYRPRLPAAGVALMVAVPLPMSVKVSPAGIWPVFRSPGGGTRWW